MSPRAARVWASLGLAGAIHLDWHLARPGMHADLSGHWAQHWLLAIPVFALLDRYLGRAPVHERWRNSILVFAGGVVVGQILEPLYELATGAGWDYAFSGIRWTAFAEFMAVGLGTWLLAMGWREFQGFHEPR